jgi:hypothetical protein
VTRTLAFLALAETLRYVGCYWLDLMCPSMRFQLLCNFRCTGQLVGQPEIRLLLGVTWRVHDSAFVASAVPQRAGVAYRIEACPVSGPVQCWQYPATHSLTSDLSRRYSSFHSPVELITTRSNFRVDWPNLTHSVSNSRQSLVTCLVYL